MKKHLKLVKSLVKKAEKAHDANEAMKFSQAACNAVNALYQVAMVEQEIKKN